MNLLSNAKWNTLSQFVKLLVQLVNIVYLAKIIPPEEYGLMAMALVVVNLGVLLRDLGTSAAIIQSSEITHIFINTVFWLNTIIGLILFISVATLSPVISYLYHQPQLLYVLLFLSITFPLSSCASAHLALLERDSKFRKVSFIEIISAVISLVIAIVLANKGFGVYSLVFQSISMNLISASLFWIVSEWRPSIRPFMSSKEIRKIFSFSANLSLFNFINYFSRNADSFIIGRYMSAFILGNYNLAYRIMLFPIQSLSYVTTRSLYPILSRNKNNNGEIKKTYLNCIFVILMIAFPLMSGLAFYSKPFILIFFGEQWGLVSDILKWLAPTAIIQVVLSTSGSVFMAKGRTEILMRLGILGAFLQVGSFIIGVHYSIVFFSFLYFIANVINFIPVMLCLMSLIGSSLIEFFKKIAPIFIAVFIMILSLLIYHNYIPLDNTKSISSLLFGVMVGCTVYIISLLFFSSLFRNYFYSFLRKRHL